MRRPLARNRFVHPIAERGQIQAFEQGLALAQQDGVHREMQAGYRDAAAERGSGMLDRMVNRLGLEARRVGDENFPELEQEVGGAVRDLGDWAIERPGIKTFRTIAIRRDAGDGEWRVLPGFRPERWTGSIAFSDEIETDDVMQFLAFAYSETTR